MNKKIFFALTLFCIKLQAAEIEPLLGSTVTWRHTRMVDNGVEQAQLTVAHKRDWLVNGVDVFNDSAGLWISRKAQDFFAEPGAFELRQFLIEKARAHNSTMAECYDKKRKYGVWMQRAAGALAIASLTTSALLAAHNEDGHDHQILERVTITGWAAVAIMYTAGLSIEAYGKHGIRIVERTAAQTACAHYTPEQLKPVLDQFDQLHPFSRKACCSSAPVHTVARAVLAEQTKYLPTTDVALQIQGS